MCMTYCFPGTNKRSVLPFLLTVVVDTFCVTGLAQLRQVRAQRSAVDFKVKCGVTYVKYDNDQRQAYVRDATLIENIAPI